MHNNPKFINLVLLNGKLQHKLLAARTAGFEQVEIWREDINNYEQGISELAQFAKQHQISFTNLQVLRDFTGMPDHERIYKRKELFQFIKIANKLGCNAIQAPANTREDCLIERIDEDLCWMASEAARYNIRIMYEPMSWSIVDNTIPLAWERIKRLDQPNVGLVVDLFHICALGGNVSQLDGIPAERIYEVQLCDMAEQPPQDKENLIKVARHQRLLPGDGIIQIEYFVDKLKNIGYMGPIGIEVFNDSLQAQPAKEVAIKAWEALNRYWR